MSNVRAAEAVWKLTSDGSVLDYGPDLSRLLVRVMRALARGRPVAAREADRIRAALGITRDEAERFLSGVAERNADGDVVGILGLTLTETRHRFAVNGARMSTWCAEDTLFLPAILNETATVESTSPVSSQTIRLTVSPDGVEEVSPASAVVSLVVVEPDRADMSSVEAIWTTFCHHIHYFASTEEAEQWAGGRDDIEIVPVQEAFELGRRVSSRFLAHLD